MALWGEMKTKQGSGPLGIDFAEYTKAVVKAEVLQAENERLHKQIESLQDALVAAAAPKAYESMQQTKYLVANPITTPDQVETQKKQQSEAEFWNKHIEYTEQPLFSDADELISSLGKMIGYDGAVASQEVVPGNSES